MIANIENTTKSVSGEKEKEAKQTSKNKESAEKRIDRFSELCAYLCVNTWSICKKFSLLFISTPQITKDGPFPIITFLLLLYSSKDFL